MEKNSTAPEWKTKEPDEGIYRANLCALPTEMVKNLSDAGETPVPMEDHIQIKGLRNPVLAVILGFSNTNLLENILGLKKEIKHIIVIEPDLSVFHQTIKRFYIGHHLKNVKIDFLLGFTGAQLKAELFKAMTTSNEKVGSRASTSMSPEIITDPFVYGEKSIKGTKEAQELISMVTDVAKQVFLAMGCSSDSFSRWEQTLRNKINLKEKYKIKPLFNQFSGIPAIVLGAGPSMDEFIEYYKANDIQNKAVLIACDASLRKLLQHNIRPHFVTRCERKLSLIFDGVKKEDTKGIYYAAYPWTPPEFIGLFEETFILYRNNGVCKWSGIDHGEVNGGVSSANAAMELAFNLGCRDIIMAGIDLCFIGEKSHTEGTEVEFDIEKSKPLWTEIDSNNGKKVTTIPVWYRCLNEYEMSILKYTGLDKKTTIINTSVEGAKINGAIARPWNDLGPLFDSNFEIREKIESLKQTPTIEERRIWDENVKKTRELLTVFRKDLKKLFLNLDDTMENSSREELKTLNQLKSHTNPTEFFNNVESLKKSLRTLYENPCNQIDKIKTKYLTDKFLNDVLIDMCQLDVFQSENRCNSLKNVVSIDHERMKSYVGISNGLFRILDYYAEKLLTILE